GFAYFVWQKSGNQQGEHKTQVHGDVNAEMNGHCFPESVSQTDIVRSDENYVIQIPSNNHFDSCSFNGSLVMINDSQVSGVKTETPHDATLSGELCSPARYNHEMNSESRFRYRETLPNSMAEVKDAARQW
ncbi:hypothetical protein M569_02411, partial [Genlisea aurea]